MFYIDKAAEDSKVKLVPNPIRRMLRGLEKIVEYLVMLLGTGPMNDRERRRTEPWMAHSSVEKVF